MRLPWVFTADARVMLAEIPFVRLRDGLPREALAHGSPFAALVGMAQSAIAPPMLHFDLGAGRVRCGDQTVVLPPALLAWYAWLAQCRVQGLGQAGFVRPGDVPPASFLAVYAAVRGRQHTAVAGAAHALREGFEPPQFQQKASKINACLDAALSLAAAPYRVERRGQRPQVRYGIALPASAIRL